jgi:hypothetical protein
LIVTSCALKEQFSGGSGQISEYRKGDIMLKPEEIQKLDVQKLHQEINQLVNQRLWLTTIAITIFGVIFGWFFEKQCTIVVANELNSIYYFAAICTLILFLLMFATSHGLLRVMRIFTTYLSEVEDSKWEKLWANYRGSYSSAGYTKLQMWLFVALGLIVFLLPLSLAALNDVYVKINIIFTIYLITFFLYEILILGMGLKYWFIGENKSRENWKTLLNPSRESTK